MSIEKLNHKTGGIENGFHNQLENKKERCIVNQTIPAMKNKMILVLCALTFGFGSVNSARAEIDKSLDAVGDIALVRPGCFVATVLGSAVFIVALPFAAMSGSVHQTADTLVVHPAQATFTRPVGDFTTLN